MSATSRLKPSSPFDEPSEPFKKPKISNDDDPKHIHPAPPGPPALKSKVRGIERLSLDKIPGNCLGTGEVVLRHRRHFFLREKTRLLAEGKLVIPGKCKFLSDGATLEWESKSVVVNRSSAKPFAGRTEETQAAPHESSNPVTLPDFLAESFGRNVQFSVGNNNIKAKPLNSVQGEVPIDVMDVSDDSAAEIDELDPSDQESNTDDPFHDADKVAVTSQPGALGSSLATPIVLSDDEEDVNDVGQPHSWITKSSLEEDQEHLTKVRRSRRKRISSSSLSSDEVTMTPSTARTVKRKIPCRSSTRLSRPHRKETLALSRSSIISVRSSSELEDINIILREAKHSTVPKANYARGRRVLVQEKHAVTVSMRGDLEYFNASERARERALSCPWNPGNGKQHVEDACSINGYGVIAFDKGPNQAVVVDGKKSMALEAQPHEGGISCLCAIGKSNSDIKFLSGGHDHTVRLWAVDVSSIDYSTEVKGLCISNPSVVHALAYISTQNRVVSASNRKLVLYDIEKDTALKKGPSSNNIYQIHVQNEQPNIMAIEVNHLDRQINIYDIRQGFTDKPPIIDIGYRGEQAFNPSRYERGAFRGSLFVRGYKDGTVKVFDIRNPTAAVSTTLLCRDVPVAHSVFWDGTTIAAFGGTMLSFINFQYS